MRTSRKLWHPASKDRLGLEWSFYCWSSFSLRSSQPHGSLIFCWNTLTSSRDTRSPLSLATEALVSQRSTYDRWFKSHFSSRNRFPHSVRIFPNPLKSKGFPKNPCEFLKQKSRNLWWFTVMHKTDCEKSQACGEGYTGLPKWLQADSFGRQYWGDPQWLISLFHFLFSCLSLRHSGPLNRCTPSSIAEIQSLFLQPHHFCCMVCHFLWSYNP